MARTCTIVYIQQSHVFFSVAPRSRSDIHISMADKFSSKCTAYGQFGGIRPHRPAVAPTWVPLTCHWFSSSFWGYLFYSDHKRAHLVFFRHISFNTFTYLLPKTLHYDSQYLLILNLPVALILLLISAYKSLRFPTVKEPVNSHTDSHAAYFSLS